MDTRLKNNENGVVGDEGGDDGGDDFTGREQCLEEQQNRGAFMYTFKLSLSI